MSKITTLILAAFLPAVLLMCAAPDLNAGQKPGAATARTAAAPPTRATTTFTLPNGLTVVLQPDHALPQVVIATRFAVGSKDETPGRTGFAHLFEHLMFMGTNRVPGNQFDMLMESQGGENNASTTSDRTTYYSLGPAEILPTLLWLDADRLQQLGEAMTKEKVDRQRDVVRNERRQSYENAPYGIGELVLPEMLWPKDHPYFHPTIGSHEDLEAATFEDVKGFFDTWYVPGNAVLTVVGDFAPAQARQTIEQTFGAIAAKPVPQHVRSEPVVTKGEVRRIVTDKVEFPKLILAWHSPAEYAEGDAAMDMVARILAGSSSSRLDKRLKIDRQLAQEVQAYQDSRELGSLFQIEITAAPGSDLEQIKRETLGVLDEFERDGPKPEELARVQAVFESAFRNRNESLLGRATRMTDYYYFLGEADAFEQDLARYTSLTPVSVRDAARAVFGSGRADLRILPAGEQVAGAGLDKRPDLYPAPGFSLPSVQSFKLPNGIPVEFVPRPGSGLFSGALLFDTGERVIAPDKAGLGALTATMLTAGAGGKDATTYAAAVEALGARVDAGEARQSLTVSVRGLTSRLGPTLDLFADAVLRPNLKEEDFARESKLQLAAIASRSDSPVAVARLVGSALLYGRDDFRGRPLEGWEGSVRTLKLADVSSAVPALLDPARARMIFVGDCTQVELAAALAQRFGKWKGQGGGAASPAAQSTGGSLQPGSLVVVDRPGAPQTVIYIARPAPAAEGLDRATRNCVQTLFGGSFTSRLMQNLRERHGYTYGARCAIAQDGDQYTLLASASVQTAVTGPALSEFKKEFEGLSGGDVSTDEIAKAIRTSKRYLVETAETTNSLSRALIEYAANRRPSDALAADLNATGKVTLDQANALAKSGLYRWSGASVILVGDREKLLPQLKEAGFPEPLAADAEGRMK